MEKDGKKVLIVEDDQVLIRMLVNMLEKQHFSVIEAKNGVEGLEAAQAAKPDLILLDIDMPKMGGLGMMKSMNEAGMKIPVVMLTNYSNPQLIADAAELGVKDYLIKSDWEIDDIAKKVKERLKITVSHE